MNEAVADQLSRIVASYGPDVCEDPRRIEALLRDLSGEHRREISVLAGAAREGVPAQLLASASLVPAPVLAERLARMLQDNLGLGETAAQWAVAAWACALHLDGYAVPASAEHITPDTRVSAGSATLDSTRRESAGDLATGELVVALVGPADHRTITDAIAAAKGGTRIVVRRGIYREQLVIDRSLELVADGPVADVVIEAVGASCIVMQADFAVVQGFTLRGRPAEAGDYHGVDVTRGHMVLEGCDISAGARACVAVHGAGVSANIRGCRIHDALWAGIAVFEQGGGVIEDCEIWANENAGVRIETGGNPVVQRCSIRDGHTCGALICEHGAGVIEDCQFSGNKNISVEIRTGGNPVVRRCRIRDGLGDGARVYEHGAGVIEDCEIWGNKSAGVRITSGADPTVRRCRIRDGQEGGVFVHDQGAGVIEDCEIWGNRLAGVEIKTGGNPVVRRCRIRDGQADGIYVHDKGRGVIEECQVWGNKGDSIDIGRGSKTTVRDIRRGP